MNDQAPPPVLQVTVLIEAGSVLATVKDPAGEEVCSHRSSSLYWLRVDLTNRSSQTSKLLLSLYPDGYVLECSMKRGESWVPLPTEHVQPLEEPDRVKREGAARTLSPASATAAKKLLRNFPFLIAAADLGVVRVQGLLLLGERTDFDTVFGFVGKTEGRVRLWIRFPELLEDGMKAPSRTITFGERGAHVVYAADEFPNPIDANRRAELYARKFVTAISKLSKGVV